jgi:hypothetical protein
MKQITALCYNDRNEIDFAVTDEQKAHFRQMVADLSDHTGEDWGEYLYSVEVTADEITGYITTEHGNTFQPTGTPIGQSLSFYRLVP